METENEKFIELDEISRSTIPREVIIEEAQ